MTPREMRLRERIDRLVDERDQLRAEAVTLRLQLKRAHGRTSAARATAAVWRVRALVGGASMQGSQSLGRATPLPRSRRDRARLRIVKDAPGFDGVGLDEQEPAA